MYLIKDSLAVFLPHSISQLLSPPWPVSPPAPNTREQGQGQRAAFSGPEGCLVSVSHRWEALLVEVSCVSDPILHKLARNSHPANSVLSYIHSHTLVPSNWLERALFAYGFASQSHPNTGTDTKLGFWGQRLLLAEGF